MLDDFFDCQKVACNIIKNSIKNNTCSHAYLINTNGFNKGFDFTKAIAKSLLCPCNYSNFEKCVGCTQCKMIDDNCFPELQIIESDGVWIKKEQTDKLQADFSKKSINSSRKVYIINGVENLNVSASNSILKFLEEPEDGIIALLITDNIYKVLNTIVSRCQVINLNKIITRNDDMILNIANNLFNSDDKIQSFIANEDSRILINHVIDFLVYLEKNKLDTIIYINDLWNQFFSSKDEYLIGFDIMIMFYNDVLNFKMKKHISLTEYLSIIDSFDYFNMGDISNRLNLLFEIKNDLYSNVNLNLLMDKLIIRMEGL